MAVVFGHEHSDIASHQLVTAPGMPADTPDDLGVPWTALDTPALVLDLDRLETNIAMMADHARRGGVALRPHFKTHKSAAIARRQLAAGAIGMTVATLDEAEALIEAGIHSPILLAYQIVATPKLDRALSLAARVSLTLAIDSAEGATRVARAAAAVGAALDVWIEIDSGLARCGVLPADAPALARVVAGLDGLRLTGMFTHGGQSYGASDAAGVAIVAEVEARAVVDAAQATRAIGIPIATVSAGSTPTARFLGGASGLTEIRPGTYALYDALQVALGTTTREHCALSIATTVVSRPAPDRAVVDAGSKTLGLDRGAHGSTLLQGYGDLIDIDGALIRLSEEHGMLAIPPDSPLAIGDRVRIIPNHVCTTTNLGRTLHGVRDGIVREIMPIDAAGGVH